MPEAPLGGLAQGTPEAQTTEQPVAAAAGGVGGGGGGGGGPDAGGDANMSELEARLNNLRRGS